MPENRLKLFNSYNRRDVRDALAPDDTYAPGAGTWGPQGIVRIKDTPGDFVLFVSFGQSNGDHHFDEGINTMAFCVGNHSHAKALILASSNS